MKITIKNLNKTICKLVGSRGFQFAMLFVMALATGIRAYAAGNGLSGINEATSMVTSYFDPGTKLIYAIGAVVGLTAASWFGACIFLIVAATILRSFFL